MVYEGYAYSENLSEAALLESYREALQNAKFTARAGVRAASEGATLISGGTVGENEALRNESLALTDVPAKLERARTLEAVALAADPRVASVPYNGYSEGESEFQILNSRGIRRRQRKTSVSGHAYCLAKDGEEGRMAGESFFTRDSSAFDAASVARTAAAKAVAKLGAVPPETGNVSRRYRRQSRVVVSRFDARFVFGEISRREDVALRRQKGRDDCVASCDIR